MPQDFKTRQRRAIAEVAEMHAGYIADVLRSFQHETDIVEHDREHFDKDEAQTVADVVKWLKQSAHACLDVAKNLGGIEPAADVLAHLADPPEEIVPRRPTDADDFPF